LKEPLKGLVIRIRSISVYVLSSVASKLGCVSRLTPALSDDLQ
jgi:hypothetical protein